MEKQRPKEIVEKYTLYPPDSRKDLSGLTIEVVREGATGRILGAQLTTMDTCGESRSMWLDAHWIKQFVDFGEGYLINRINEPGVLPDGRRNDEP
jgi:hypothetical protein